MIEFRACGRKNGHLSCCIIKYQNSVMKFRIISIVAFLLFMNCVMKAQNVIDSLTTKHDVRLHGNLYHQHHDFFGKAFSYQGVEVGLIRDHNLFGGLYGSCFVSNLKAEINHNLQFIWVGQSGIYAGYIYNAEKRIHPGIQLNIGAFSLRTDENNFGLFHTGNAQFNLNGLVISPQLFGELNITDWFNIRTGLSYNFYSYKDHSLVKTSDLNHISFTFGLVFISK